MPPDDPREQTVDPAPERRALAWSAAAAIVVILWLVRPIALGLLVGTLLAFITQPVFDRLKRHIGARWAAPATVVAASLALVATLGGLGWLFVSRGTALSTELAATAGPRGIVDEFVARVGPLTSRLGVSPDDLRSRVHMLATDAMDSIAHVAEVVASATGSALLALFFAMLAMHYILRHGGGMSRSLAKVLPLRPAYTIELLAEFRRVGRATLLGSVVTAIVQGAFATIGYWIAGVPEPIFFGAATAVASFVPAVGTLLVIVPVGVGLMLAGHPVRAIVELAWGLVFVIGVSDYVIRPRLVRGEAKVPSLVTFAALFGGIEVLGLKGILVGPVLMALSLAVLRLYASEARVRRHLDPEEPPAGEPP
jgi:predicted PurR-regulated permease PerM